MHIKQKTAYKKEKKKNADTESNIAIEVIAHTSIPDDAWCSKTELLVHEFND